MKEFQFRLTQCIHKMLCQVLLLDVVQDLFYWQAEFFHLFSIDKQKYLVRQQLYKIIEQNRQI